MTTEAPPQEGTETPPAPQEGTETPPQEGNADELPQWARDALAKANREAANYRTKAQANAQAARELEQVRQSSMTEQEKAVAQAKAEARTEALREAGGRLVAAEVRAAAAGRLDDKQLSTLLDGLNVAAFVSEDGEVDAKRIGQFVDGIAPKNTTTGAPTGFPDLGQGARGLNTGDGDMNAAIRRSLGR